MPVFHLMAYLTVWALGVGLAAVGFAAGAYIALAVLVIVVLHKHRRSTPHRA